MNSKYSLIDLDTAIKIVVKCDMLNCGYVSELVHMVNMGLNRHVTGLMQRGEIQDRGVLSYMSTKIGARPETILGCTVKYEMATMFIVDGQDKITDSIKMLSINKNDKEAIKKYNKVAVLGGDYCGVCLQIAVTMFMNGKKVDEKIFMRKMLKYKEKDDTIESIEEIGEKIEIGILEIFSTMAEDNKRKSEGEFQLKRSLKELMIKSKTTWALNGFDSIKVGRYEGR